MCTYGRVALLFRVFGGIVFGAMALGQMSHFAPDAGKAQASAARIFYLLDRKPAIDSSSTDGQKPVSAPSSAQSRDVSLPTHHPPPSLRSYPCS